MKILTHFKFREKYSDLAIKIDKEIERLKILRGQIGIRWNYHHTKFMNKNVVGR